MRSRISAEGVPVMASTKFKLALTNARFPFRYSRAGSASLQPGLDVAPRASVAFVGTHTSFDYNQPQLLYVENVLPIAEGVLSCGVQREILPISPAVTDFDQCITIRDFQENHFLFVPGRGKNYVYDVATATWVSRNPFSWSSDRTIVSHAYVNGRTFICYEADRVIEWNGGTNTFATLSLTLPSGYAMSDIRGIAGISNYLILFTDIEILWCSALDVLDFDDPVGKSGLQIPTDVKGRITGIRSLSGGGLIYTSRNCVAMFATNNADAPFTYREVKNSGGVSSTEQVTGDSNQAEHYTYGPSGLQRVNMQSAVSVLPDCADFLAGKSYDQWNTATGEVDTIQQLTALDIKVQMLGNRYLFISYGKQNGQFQFALVYDEVLERWGKVKVPHVDITVLPTSVASTLPLLINELIAPIEAYTMDIADLLRQYGTSLPLRAGFCFLQNDGSMYSLLGNADGNFAGVALVGHIQMTRNRTVMSQSVVLHGLSSDPAPTVRLIGSLPGNGYDRDSIKTPMLVKATARMKEYKGSWVFENYDVAVEGSFELVTLIAEASVHGSR